MTKHHRIVLERGTKKIFASAIDWPGWSRSGKSDDNAIANLVAYADRYQKIAELAGVRGVAATAADPEVVETLQGRGATDFGIPDKVARVEHEFMTEAECERQLKLLQACWTWFDDVAAKVSPELKKGPRGGGRDRDQIIEHTLEAEQGYARQIGLKTPRVSLDTSEALLQHRTTIIDVVRETNADKTETSWPLRYFLRRAGWHVLDHAWEMEDKDLSPSDSSTQPVDAR